MESSKLMMHLKATASSLYLRPKMSIESFRRWQSSNRNIKLPVVRMLIMTSLKLKIMARSMKKQTSGQPSKT